MADAPLFSHEAEAAVLGGLFVSPVDFGEVAARVAAGDFAEHAHRLIFAAMTAVQQTGAPLDIVTVAEHLERVGHLPAPVEFHYLAVLARDTPSAANVLAYADLVCDYARRRSLIKLADDLARWARAEPDAAAAVAKTRGALDGLESGAPGGERGAGALHGQHALAVARSPGDHVQPARRQPVQVPVQVQQPGRDAAQFVRPVGPFVQGGQGLRQDVRQRARPAQRGGVQPVQRRARSRDGGSGVRFGPRPAGQVVGQLD